MKTENKPTKVSTITTNPMARKKFVLTDSGSMAAKDLFNKVKDEVETGLKGIYPGIGASSRGSYAGDYAGEYRNLHLASQELAFAHQPLILVSVFLSYNDNRVKLSFSGSEMAKKGTNASEFIKGIVAKYSGKEIRQERAEAAKTG